MFMELPPSLSREVLFCTSSVSQGSRGDTILFCRVALGESSTPGLEGSHRGHSSRAGEFGFSAFDKKLHVELLHSTQTEAAAAARGSKPALGIPVEEHLTLDLPPGTCASSAAHRASSSLFPLQLLLVFVPSGSRSRNALLNIVQSFLIPLFLAS